MKAGHLMFVCLLGAGAPSVLPAAPTASPTVARVFTAAGLPTDETYFPIAVWLQDPRNAQRYKAAGITLYVGLWQGPTEIQLAAMTKAGLPVVCDQNATGLAHRENPIIAAWMHGDEPDNAQALPGGRGYGPPIVPEVIVRDYARLREADPSRPVLLNLGQGVAFDNYIGRGVRRNRPEDYPQYVKGCDIASFDIYPVAHDSPEVAGKLEFVARGVERLVSWTGGKKPVWSCIECTGIDGHGGKATPAQVRSEVWMALIRGARGLIYFVHQFKPEFKEAALLEDAEMLAAITALNQQIRELAPALNSPTLDEGLGITNPAGTPVAAVLKEHDGTAYLFAVNLTPQQATATFTLKRTETTAAAPLDGSPPLPLDKGSFTAAFEPYAVQLYRLRQ